MFMLNVKNNRKRNKKLCVHTIKGHYTLARQRLSLDPNRKCMAHSGGVIEEYTEELLIEVWEDLRKIVIVTEV